MWIVNVINIFECSPSKACSIFFYDRPQTKATLCWIYVEWKRRDKYHKIYGQNIIDTVAIDILHVNSGSAILWPKCVCYLQRHTIHSPFLIRCQNDTQKMECNNKSISDYFVFFFLSLSRFGVRKKLHVFLITTKIQTNIQHNNKNHFIGECLFFLWKSPML